MTEQSAAKIRKRRASSRRGIFVFDILLVSLNAGFVALIYFNASALISNAPEIGIAMGDAFKIFLLILAWTVGNILLFAGLVKATHRAGESK